MLRTVGDSVSTETIGVAPWMALPETQAVIAALEARGFPGCARFVGGCVRNTLMGKPIDDIDIATTLTPDQVIEALGEAGLRAIPTGVDHGTVTALSNGRPYEITTLRRDVPTDGRRAVVRSPRTGTRTPSAAISASTPSMSTSTAGSTTRPARG